MSIFNPCDHQNVVQLRSEKNLANGYAGLNASAEIDAGQIPFGASALTVCEGGDSRLTNDRTASGLRTATTVVSISGASAPTSGQVLTATSGSAANWQTPSGGGGSDPWTIVRVNNDADFTTSSATAVDVTGLSFAPQANLRYMFEAVLGIRTATATVNPRSGLAWATGLSDGVCSIDTAQTATTRLTTNGNIGAALLVAVGGIPNTTQSWPVTVWGWARAGASPSGNIRIQLASETAGTVVRIVAGSYLRFRTY